MNIGKSTNEQNREAQRRSDKNLKRGEPASPQGL